MAFVSQLINDNGNPAARQFVIESPSGHGKYFQSYNSVVCHLSGNNIILSLDWEYSNTTMKHLYIFLRQNGYYTYNSAKAVRKAIQNGEIALAEVCSLEVI